MAKTINSTMKYTVILYDSSGNHSNSKRKCNSLSSVRIIFEAWVEEVGRYANEQQAEGLVYGCDPDVERDPYPILSLSVGKRGGVRLQPT